MHLHMILPAIQTITRSLIVRHISWGQWERSIHGASQWRHDICLGLLICTVCMHVCMYLLLTTHSCSIDDYYNPLYDAADSESHQQCRMSMMTTTSSSLFSSTKQCWRRVWSLKTTRFGLLCIANTTPLNFPSRYGRVHMHHTIPYHTIPYHTIHLEWRWSVAIFKA